METLRKITYSWKAAQEFKYKLLKTLELEDYFNKYLTESYVGQLKTYTVIHIFVNILNIIFLVVFSNNRNYVIADCLFCTLSALCVVFLYYLIKRMDCNKYHNILILTTILPLLILFGSDLAVPKYLYMESVIRPGHEAYIIYAIYEFIPFYDIQNCVYLGVFVSVFNLFCLGVFYTEEDAFFLIKLLSTTFYVLTINLFGLFARLIRQTSLLEVFFARWEVIKQTIIFKYQNAQEQNLLLSIIPPNTANDIVADIMNQIKSIEESPDPEREIKHLKIKPSKLYTYFHTDVSILYADIVNYTHLTTTLEVKPLVKTLHELFVKFDAAAVIYNCLRIKFLGDCYYCVSGIPDKNPDHAKSCVELGLNMIKIIRAVRIRRKLAIDMRIGIHSGNVIAGIIGSAKWQYDIWSKDVDIANKLESTGVPRVHVSQYTLSMLNGAYNYEDGPQKAKEDQFLIKHNIPVTYLIIDDNPDSGSVDFVQEVQEGDSEYMETFHIAHFIHEYKQIREDAKYEMSKQFIKLRGSRRISKRIDASKNVMKKPIPVILLLTNCKEEMIFWNEPDILLKYTCLMALFTYCGVIFVTTINNPVNPNFFFEYILGITILLFWLIILWYQSLWNWIWKKEYDSDKIIIKNKFSSFMFNLYEKIIRSLLLRMTIYVTVLLSNLLCSLSGLFECDIYENTPHTLKDRTELEKIYNVCFNAWYFTQTLMIARCINFIFVQIPFIFKFTLDIIITSFYIWLLLSKYYYVYEFSISSNISLPGNYAHLYTVLIQFALLNLIVRKHEWYYKTDYLWKKQLETKKKETEISKLTSKLLIENILPSHVADIYLAKKITSELYTERYDNVAIMFASIKNYEIGLVGLRVLNEIFCDFDDKLTKYSGRLKIEKIKVVGLTYMAACGLHPAFSTETEYKKKRVGASNWSKVRRSLLSNEVINEIYEQNPYLNVFMMTEFALELMRTLKKFNIEYSSGGVEIAEGILRIGISHGEVMGGVVGLSKPFYDVWGNTINMASRMDSTGEIGKIQVTEETASVLQDFNIQCDYRGLTYVKGRDYLPTYFVGINDDLEFIPRVINDPIFEINTRRRLAQQKREDAMEQPEETRATKEDVE